MRLIGQVRGQLAGVENFIFMRSLHSLEGNRGRQLDLPGETGGRRDLSESR